MCGAATSLCQGRAFGRVLGDAVAVRCTYHLKAYAIARGAKRRQELVDVMAGRAMLEVELLGVSTMFRKREHSDKELLCAEACLRTIQLLSCVRLPFARYLNAAVSNGSLVGQPCSRAKAFGPLSMLVFVA